MSNFWNPFNQYSVGYGLGSALSSFVHNMSQSLQQAGVQGTPVFVPPPSWTVPTTHHQQHYFPSQFPHMGMDILQHGFASGIGPLMLRPPYYQGNVPPMQISELESTVPSLPVPLPRSPDCASDETITIPDDETLPESPLKIEICRPSRITEEEKGAGETPKKELFFIDKTGNREATGDNDDLIIVEEKKVHDSTPEEEDSISESEDSEDPSSDDERTSRRFNRLENSKDRLRRLRKQSQKKVETLEVDDSEDSVVVIEDCFSRSSVKTLVNVQKLDTSGAADDDEILDLEIDESEFLESEECSERISHPPTPTEQLPGDDVGRAKDPIVSPAAEESEIEDVEMDIVDYKDKVKIADKEVPHKIAAEDQVKIPDKVVVESSDVGPKGSNELFETSKFGVFKGSDGKRIIVRKPRDETRASQPKDGAARVVNAKRKLETSIQNPRKKLKLQKGRGVTKRVPRGVGMKHKVPNFTHRRFFDKYFRKKMTAASLAVQIRNFTGKRTLFQQKKFRVGRNRPVSTANSSAASSSLADYTPNPVPRPNEGANLRPIAIDGSNVAFAHGKNKTFSPKGIALAAEFFQKIGSPVKVFVPLHRKKAIEGIVDQELVVFTPSRKKAGKMVVCYDDRFILEFAEKKGAVVVSNDYYRDLVDENSEWAKVIESRLLMYTFADDMFMVPRDPLGKDGPSLDTVLMF